jgi:hypothetical protein
MQKQCCSCKEIKETSEFNKNKYKKDGLQTQCRECSHKKFRDYYHKNLERQKTITIARSKRNKTLTKEKIFKLLANSACAKCGEKDPLVLEFNHLGNKEKDISLMVAHNLSWARIEKEISKCEVLCANCHKRYTHQQQNTYRWRLLQESGQTSQV